MTRIDLKYWISLWHEIGARGDPTPWHRRIVGAYTESHRHYHNLQHLDECLTELAANRKTPERPAVMAAALWFHDAVYDPRSTTNEEDSAKLARGCLASAGVDGDAIETVRQLILCTKTHEPDSVADAALLIDIDLAILGQSPARFWDYERGIRAEYAWVPSPTYAQKRTEILMRFLDRPTIYRTEPFRLKYEAAARANLQAAIKRLPMLPS